MSENRARDFSRRSLLKGTAAGAVAASLGSATSFAWMAPAAAAEPVPMPPHGAELRGMDLVIESPNSEGRFGFMFKDQPPFRPSDDLLKRLGQEMEERPRVGKDPYTDPVTGQTVTATNNHNDAFSENPNPKLTSGFTFVGQFVDHDITFDQTPINQQEEDPDATTNFRVPRYDLDALYGRGPSQDPDLYDSADRDKFKLVKTTHTTIRSDTLKTPEVVYDVPRDANGKAVIADRRNDQTIIINQMHVAMQMFHNKLVDYMRALRVPRAAVFESARRLARWHYQWMVTHDFLPAIVGQKMADSVYKEVLTGVPIINIKYYKPTNPLGRPFIPVEFSVAAYRFGHSMTRPRYTVRDYVTTAVDPATGKNVSVAVSSVPLFEASPSDNNLNGSRPVPARLKIQWSKFFNLGEARTARPVRQFDASLGGALFSMPPTALPDTVTSENLLSVRNLKRGKLVGLPSGQQVAREMGVEPLTNAQLSQNHRIHVKVPIVGNVVEIVPPGEFDEENQALTQIFAEDGWDAEAPLWFYILKEAELVGDGTPDGKARTLGPVGGRIVAEVLVGLLQHDKNSYLTLQPTWKPAPPIAPARGKFTMADLLKYAGVWS
jgi:Animal haem peroxidase/TAT (twin-arginine translocation) pathway signal sequence